MLKYKILENKANTSLPCNYDEEARDAKVTCKDLLSSTVRETSTKNMNVIVVNKYYVARPDLISLAVYGTDAYADIICKVNGISNPFELNEDMIVYTPSLSDIESMFVGSVTGPCELLSDDEYIAKEGDSCAKHKNDFRTPSTPLKGQDTGFVIDRKNGVVWY